MLHMHQFEVFQSIYTLKEEDLKIFVRVNNFLTARIRATYHESYSSYFSRELQCLKYIPCAFEGHSIKIHRDSIWSGIHQYRQMWNIYSKIVFAPPVNFT